MIFIFGAAHERPCEMFIFLFSVEQQNSSSRFHFWPLTEILQIHFRRRWSSVLSVLCYKFGLVCDKSTVNLSLCLDVASYVASFPVQFELSSCD